jgi:tRNA G18 (ribose-2'-O)-methylase SpoU
MNLGALCRTAEVFRLQSLVVPSLHILDNWEFRKVAVSAHQWQPLAACPTEDLAVWLHQYQASGWEIVALTRYPASTLLPTFVFAPQTVLLLGRELTGIPMKLIQQCDRVVTIPQFGQVESLNVQTAAAIAAYAYVTQYSDTAGNHPSP